MRVVTGRVSGAVSPSDRSNLRPDSPLAGQLAFKLMDVLSLPRELLKLQTCDIQTFPSLRLSTLRSPFPCLLLNFLVKPKAA